MKLLLLLSILSTQLLAEVVTYQVDKKSYQGYFVKSKRNKLTVFIIHDWDGLTEYEIKRSDMLAKMGYSVFAVDLFGQGIRPTEDKDKKQHTGVLYNDRDKMRKILNTSLEVAQKNGLNTENAVAIGYCFGGAAVLEWARSGASLKGFASFHGGLATPLGQNYKTTKGSVLIFHGSADDHITLDDFAKLGKELEESKVPHEITAYGGAPHAFTVFGSSRYRKEADKASWARLSSFLSHL